MSHLLLVEDEAPLRRALALTLRARGYQVTEAPDGAKARQALRRGLVDAVIVDLGLPDVDGVDLAREMRGSYPDKPILVLSARRDQADKVSALDAGADDYLTKPFGIDELLARIRAALRRVERASEPMVVHTDDFTVDLGRKTVTRRDGSTVHLTPTEWGLLEALVRANGMLVESRELLGEVWGPGYEEQTNYLRVYLAQLRRKLEPQPGHPRYLITYPGMGYLFQAAG